MAASKNQLRLVDQLKVYGFVRKDNFYNLKIPHAILLLVAIFSSCGEFMEFVARNLGILTATGSKLRIFKERSDYPYHGWQAIFNLSHIGHIVVKPGESGVFLWRIKLLKFNPSGTFWVGLFGKDHKQVRRPIFYGIQSNYNRKMSMFRFTPGRLPHPKDACGEGCSELRLEEGNYLEIILNKPEKKVQFQLAGHCTEWNFLRILQCRTEVSYQLLIKLCCDDVVVEIVDFYQKA